MTKLRQALALHREEARQQSERWLEDNGRLQDALTHYQSLYTEAPIGYLILSRSGIVIEANRAASMLLGVEHGSLRGRPLMVFVEQTHTGSILRHLMRCRAGDDDLRCELALRHSSGTSVPVEILSRRVWIGTDRTAYQTVLRDLTERLEAERALAASEKRYRDIVETANEGICIVDATNHITFVNRAFRRLVGRSSDELVGRPAEDLRLPDDLNASRRSFARREIGAGGISEERLQRVDGSVVWTLVSSSLMHDADGQFAGMLRMYTDISARKELDESRNQLVRHLVRAQEAERQRVSRELHDRMGQHLVGFSLGLDRLRQLGSTSGEVNQVTQRLQQIAHTMTRDIQTLALELRPAALDDLGLADAVSNYADGIAQRFGIELDVQCRETMPRLDSATETTVYRVVQEALTNVLKHSGAHRVSIILEPRGNTLQTIIEDDGVGFDAEKVMRPGARGDRLGLTGMMERAALVGGELQIESRRGRGTTLFLRVPLGAEEQQGDKEAAPATGR